MALSMKKYKGIQEMQNRKEKAGVKREDKNTKETEQTNMAIEDEDFEAYDYGF